jgi:hypothetical protein
MNVSQIIDSLGGTVAVAKLCQIKPPSVSEWKRNNAIPHAWEMFLRQIRPDAFQASEGGRKGRSIKKAS